MKNRDEVLVKGTRIEVRNNDLNTALKKFKKVIQDENILQEYQKKQFYEKPSVARRRRKAAARARHLKEISQREK